MKKLKYPVLLSLLVMLFLAGCEATEMSMEIFLNNNEGVKASLDIVDHSRLKLDENSGRIYVVRGDTVLLEGRFFTQGEFSSYIEEISAKYSVKILKAVPEESPSFYSFEAAVDDQIQYGFLEKIVGSDQTSILMVSPDLSYEEAEELFGQLHFERIK